MIVESVLRSIGRTSALAEAATLIVAVSGGCDSVAMLHILRALRKRLDLALHVASLDHGIRGEAGQDDVNFVRGLAERWQLPCTTARVNVPALAREWGVGLEAAARRARLRFPRGCGARRKQQLCRCRTSCGATRPKPSSLRIAPRQRYARPRRNARRIRPCPFIPRSRSSVPFCRFVARTT